MKWPLPRYGVAVLAACVLAVLPAVVFLYAAWHSPAVQQASVWADLFSPYVLLDLATLCALGSAYGAFRKWLHGATSVPSSGDDVRPARDPLIGYTLLGLWLGIS